MLSLFAVFLLVAALGWRDYLRAGRVNLPTTLANIAEGSGGQGFFDAGRSILKPEAEAAVALVARKAVETAQLQRQRREVGANHIQVIGYASPEGKKNQQLAEDRALAVRNYLVNNLQIPEECVVVASYADSHSTLLQSWLHKGNTLASFRALRTPEEQRRVLGVSNNELQKERRVAILSVYHSDSTCRLDQIVLRNADAVIPAGGVSREPGAPTYAESAPVRVGGAINSPSKIKDVNPIYPTIARAARVQGVVIIEATIGVDGRVTDAKVVRSIPLLDEAALVAVRQWEFTPTTLNGQPVPVVMTVTVDFTLQ